MKRMHVMTVPFEAAQFRRELANPACGGYCAFEGWVRDTHDGRSVEGLDYEAYVELAEGEGERIIDEARARFAIADARCVHRIGALTVGDLAIWIGVSAAHRDAAFAGCRYIIDEAKQRLPIWKKERYTSGAASWVMPAKENTITSPDRADEQDD